MLKLFFQLAVTFEHSRQFVDQILARTLDQAGSFLELLFGSIQVSQCGCAGHGFNTTNTRSHAAFADDFHQADVTGALGVDTATQLNREITTHAQHAHAVAVLLAKQRHGAFFLGGFDVGFFSLDRGILANLGVDDIFQRLDLLRLDRFEVAEVKTHALAVNQRAFLLNVLAQNLAQGGVQQVGGRVVQRRGVTHIGVHLGFNGFAHFQAARSNHAVVQESATGLGGVAHVKAGSTRLQVTAIADLTARFGIERGLVENHHTLVAFVQAGNRLPFFIQRNHLGRGLGSVVTDKLGRHVDFDQGVVVQAKRAGRTGTHTLGFHLAFEAFFVHGQVALAGDIGRQVHREAVGVVELEHYVARHHGALELSQIQLEDFQTLLQGLGELLFFSLEHALDIGLLAHQLREAGTHLGHQGRDDLVEEIASSTQLVAMTAGATNDAAQHVAATFVRWQYTVGDQEAARTDMVRYHLERCLAFVGAADRVRRCGQQALEQVDIVVGVDVLHHRTDPLQAHAGVYRRRWQRMQHAIGGAVELHENVVPDFDVTVAVFVWRARRATPDFRAVIVENLGARAARAGIAHGPEVVRCIRRALVVADTDHALGRHADVLGPDVVGFVIAGVDGHPQLVFGQLENTGQEGPGEIDRIFLEVIAKAEIAEHFKEGVVTGGVTDVFQVAVLAAGTHALLAAGRSGVGTFFLTQETVLELVHPRVGEQQGRVVIRDQGAGRDTGVTLLLEEAKEGFTDFCAFHRFFHGGCGQRQVNHVNRQCDSQRAALYRPFAPGTACLYDSDKQLDGLKAY